MHVWMRDAKKKYMYPLRIQFVGIGKKCILDANCVHECSDYEQYSNLKVQGKDTNQEQSKHGLLSIVQVGSGAIEE